MKATALWVAGLVALTAKADVRNWGGSEGGDWFVPANWVENAVPDTGDTVTIDAGSVWLTNATAQLAGFSISNAVMTFTNWTTVLRADSVAVGAGGSLQHALCDIDAAPEVTNRVYIVADSVTIGEGGMIDANASGFAGRFRANGQGPGGGTVQSNSGGGGGYGGKGGRGHAAHGNNYGGPAYGHPDFPLLPGSAGAGDNFSSGGGMGGHGGGLVWIEASGRVTVAGTVRANGGTGGDRHSGGGSGGGVYIDCETLAGDGVIEANGGNRNGEGGGGGGGRLSIHFDPAAQALEAVRPTISYSAFHATSYQTADLDAGTIHLSAPTFLPEALFNVFPKKIYVYNITNWAPNSLTVQDTTVVFSTPGIALSVTNDVVLNNGKLSLALSNNVIHVGGDLTLSGVSTLTFPQTGLLDPGSASWTNHAARIEVTGGLSIGSGSILYPGAHPTNGGSIQFAVGHFTLAAGGLVDADALGFGGGSYPSHGYGYAGGGGKSTSTRGGGGGHGGAGGRASHATATGGLVNDDAEAPLWPGGGGGAGSGKNASSGGGLVWIESGDKIEIHGVIRANGGPGGDQIGAGAGGTIRLAAPEIVGTGALQAAGGGGSSNSGGGGGGRILLASWVADQYFGSIDVNGGTGYVAGGDGTVRRLQDTSYPFVLTIDGTPARYAVPEPLDYGMYAMEEGAVRTNEVALIAEKTATTRFHCLGYTLDDGETVPVQNIATQAVFTVSTNLWLTWNWTNQWYLATAAGDNGSLQVDRSGWYTNADSVTVKAVADEDHAFLQWSGSGVPVGQADQNPLTLTMDQAREVHANFVSTLPQTRVWNGTGNWLTPGNWSPEGIPGPNDDLTLESGVCTVSDPLTVGTLAVADSATLWFENWNTSLTAVELNVLSNGVITHALTDTVTDPAKTNRVYVIADTVTVEAGGRIDVDGCGFRGGYGAAGQGPGGGGFNATSGGGGGHGGAGGGSRHGAAGGPAYGSGDEPLLPGSGGAGVSGYFGGNGGGLVRIEAGGKMTLDGKILAGGSTSSGAKNGGGAGGGVSIVCETFEGMGEIRANGANGNDSECGAGGGGRIAVSYAPAAQAALATQPTVRIFSAPGAPTAWTSPQEGTVFLADSVFLTETPGEILGSDMRVYGIQTWSPDRLTHTQHALYFEEPGFELSVAEEMTVGSGTLGFRGADIFCGADVVLTNGGVLTMRSDLLGTEGLHVSGGMRIDNGGWTYQFGVDNPHSLTIGGNLELTNGATFTLRGGPTNGVSNPAYGGLLDLSGRDLTLPDGCVFYPRSHPTNGGSVKVRARRVTLEEGAIINADGGGFAGAASPTRGFGPGSGYGDNNSAGGAGYGGEGGHGNHSYAYGGPDYGDSEHPRMPGSAGGCLYGPQGKPTAFYIGGAGGGLVWLDVERTLRLDGVITANGNSAAAGNGGGGSGGAIYLSCSSFAGGGGLRAEGANSGSEGGGGGGGRIALWRVRDTSDIAEISVAAATVRPGDPGTFFEGWLSPKGTLLLLK